LEYRKLVRDGELLSALGYGCMRLPSKAGRVDEEKAIAQMLYAYENGVNYFDTAYPYHNGKSEEVLGRFIKKNNIREKVYIADKLPQFLVKRKEQIQEYFNVQLKRLDTDYIDYYLLHMLDSYASWEKMKKFGIIEFLENKKANGQIRHAGFSFHGLASEFIKILEDYNWDFCQIQYNYLDENNQAGLEGLRRAYELGIGVVIMEPLRGGNLAAKAPDKVKAKFAEYKEKRSPAFWALRWIWNHKEVSLLLSGMNVDEHIKENIEVANLTTPGSMSQEELEIVNEVKNIYRSLMKVPCTGCNYCMPCPFGVEIPTTFTNYNDKYFFGGIMPRFQYASRALGLIGAKKSSVDLCTQCGLCEKHCPQNIEIRKELQIAKKELDSRAIRFGVRIAAKVMGISGNQEEGQ